MVSKLFLGAVAGLTAAVGYCIYFDQKRRSDPLFRQKLREKRARRHADQNRQAGMPDASDPEAMQRYFMIQLQRGEACLMNGMVEESVQHFCNALRTSGSPNHILRVLAESLPPQIFAMIVRRLEEESGVRSGGVPGVGVTRTTTTTVGPDGIEIEEEKETTVFGRAGTAGATVTLVDDDLEFGNCCCS